MFVDEVVIEVKGGDGGNGMTSFRREKFVAAGGPSGGDGGHGGNIVFTVDEGINTLLDFRERKFYQAEAGENGGSKNMHGKDGEDLLITVPPGTTVTDTKTGKVIADLVEDGQRVVIAEGGRGGRGNTRFKSSTRQAPKFSENGEPGQERKVKLELKLLADVGLVGYPSVGKSTIISKVSAAKPKIGAYHFTTLKPNLGVVKVGNYSSFVMADIPGLIEGAHSGVGLGDDFLRHIERTRVIIHVLDISGMEGRDPLDDFRRINDELRKFNEKLMERPQIIAANKMDLPQAEENLENLKEVLEKEGYEVYPISAVTGQGIDELIQRTDVLVKETPDFFEEDEEEEEVIIRGPQPGEEDDLFDIVEEGGIYRVVGDEIKRKVAMADLSTDDGLYHFLRMLKKLGVNDALRESGIKEGDTVNIEGLEFEYSE
ncbi:GTPase ObgE [Orenia marismortui]|uniref:GTPase ObgE n=1 Tax=Orenia marismortui TaxID=46469 RepID=UPI000380A009|nr:GTPase ObgE [Orenia marismortui]